MNRRICINCFSENTYISKKGYEYWYTVKEGNLCKKCYSKLIWNPNRTSEYQKKYNDMKVKFLDRFVSLKENPRKGQCSMCNKKIGDKYINCKGKEAIIKRTGIHHINYHEGNPLKDTIELCTSCHVILHKRKEVKEE